MRLQNLLFLFTFLILSGCIPGADKASICPAGQTFDQVKRACSGAITNINTGGPVNTTTTLTLEEDASNGTIVYLNYNDPDGDLATACTVTPNINLIYTPGSCTCNASGVCSFILQTYAHHNSQYVSSNGFNFTYNVTANSSTSATTNVVVTVNPVDDAPYDLSKYVSDWNLAVTPSSSNLNNKVLIIGAASQTGDSFNNYKLNFTATENDTSLLANISVADFDQGSHSIEILNYQNLSLVTSSCPAASTTYNVSTTVIFGGGHIGNKRSCSINIFKDTNYSGLASLQFRIRSLVNGVYTSTPIYTIQGNYSAVDDAPVAQPTQIAAQTFTEDTEKIITLPYTDIEGDVAVNGTSGCAVPSLTNLIISTPCSCSNSVCTVGLTPSPNTFSNGSTSFSFQYTITTASTFPVFTLSTSALSSAFSLITVTGVADNPVAGTGGLAPFTTPNTGLTEDVAQEFTLLYTDYDVASPSGTATTCSVSSATNGTLGACSCTLGVCKVTFTPAADYSGFAGFNYSISRGTSPVRTFSSPATVSYNYAAVNDAPVLTLPGSANTNMNTPIYVPITKLDEGGGSDEDTQIVTLSAFTSTAFVNSISIVQYNSGSETNLADGATDVSATQWYLKIVPVDNVYGSTSVPVTISDGTVSTTTTLPLVINPVYAVHKGWKNIQAAGNKLDHDGSIIEPKFVRLDWEDFDMYGGTIQGFNVYRGAPNIDWTTPINTTMIPATQKYFIDTDTNLTYSTDYFYAVRPVDLTYSQSISPYTMTSTLISLVSSAENSYGIVRITFPPDNSAYLHRWAVNKEICQKMGKATDSLNNFRCSYSGAGDNNFNYDYGGNAYVDMNEMGCNYSQTDCGNGACIGSGLPSTTGCNGSACSAPLASTTNPILYYDRTSGRCYYSVSMFGGGANIWTQVGSTFGNNYSRYVKLTNSNMPPLTNVNSAAAQAICEGRNTGVSERLLTRPEFIAAAAWDTTSLTDASITALETGADLSSSNKFCNSSSAAGLTVSDDLNLPTVDTDTLPSTTTSTHRTLVTGSSTTAQCRSRYGIQDLVGNVREFNSDTVTCASSVDCTATTSTSLILPSYTNQWSSFPALTLYIASTYMNMTNAPFTSWRIATAANGYSWMLLPYGLPISANGPFDYTTINGTTGNKISSAQLHDDAINFNTAALAGISGVVTSGGSFSNGTEGGRWSMEWIPTTTSDSKTGFRCIHKF